LLKGFFLVTQSSISSKRLAILTDREAFSQFDSKWLIKVNSEYLLRDTSIHTTSLTRPPFFHWSACAKAEKWAVIYLCARGIHFASLSCFYIWFWKCSDRVAFFVFNFLVYIYLCLARNQDNLSDRSDISTRGLLSQWTCTIRM
jgi:hypothetical protein